MTTTERPGTLAEAKAALMTQLPHIRKEATAQYGKYADLADVSRQLLPVLGELGLSFTSRPTLVQRPDGRSEFVLAYALQHYTGEKEEGEYPLPSSTPQTMGGAITYARRYSLCAVTGAVADEDDDAQAAEAAAKPKRTRTSKELQGDDARAHNALQPRRSDNASRTERVRNTAGVVDDWSSVNGNGERQPAGELPHDYPPGERQIGALQGHFKRLGFSDDEREDRLKAAAALAGASPITSLNDLTQEQVKQATREIQVMRDRGALVERLIAIKEAQVAAP